MKITYDWLKDHLKTNLKEKNLLEQLINIGLEVESVENPSAGNELFKVAKIIKTAKHPNADRLKVCDVDVGEKELKKVVCGAANAKEGLITIYAPPGAIIPKTKIKFALLFNFSDRPYASTNEGIFFLRTALEIAKIGGFLKSFKNGYIILSISEVSVVECI